MSEKEAAAKGGHGAVAAEEVLPEEPIRLDYLNRLNERYEAWISTYNKGELLIIDVDNNNFHEDKEDLGGIITAIDGKLNNLFS